MSTAYERLAWSDPYAPDSAGPTLDLSELVPASWPETTQSLNRTVARWEEGDLRLIQDPDLRAPAREIGALGSVPFYVSNYAVQTIQNVVWSGGGNYASHKRIAGTTLVEATGSDADTISFDMVLSANLGVNPLDAIAQILNAEREQTFLLLTIGDHAYGRYRWLIESHKIKLDQFDLNGNLMTATVSVKLVEYLKE